MLESVADKPLVTADVSAAALEPGALWADFTVDSDTMTAEDFTRALHPEALIPPGTCLPDS